MGLSGVKVLREHRHTDGETKTIEQVIEIKRWDPLLYGGSAYAKVSAIRRRDKAKQRNH